MRSTKLAAALLLVSLACLPCISAAAEHPQAYLGLDFRWQRNKDERFLRVERVATNGPAQRAGVRAGDLITKIGGVAVGFGDELDFLIFMREQKPGQQLALDVVRAGRPLRLIAVLEALPESRRAAWEAGFRAAQQKRIAAQRDHP